MTITPQTGRIAHVRDWLAWKLMNLSAKLATPWYRGMLTGAVYYGLDRAAKDAGHDGCPIAPSESYRQEVLRALLRDDEQIVRREV